MIVIGPITLHSWNQVYFFLMGGLISFFLSLANYAPWETKEYSILGRLLYGINAFLWNYMYIIYYWLLGGRVSTK